MPQFQKYRAKWIGIAISSDIFGKALQEETRVTNYFEVRSIAEQESLQKLEFVSRYNQKPSRYFVGYSVAIVKKSKKILFGNMVYWKGLRNSAVHSIVQIE